MCSPSWKRLDTADLNHPQEMPFLSQMNELIARRDIPPIFRQLPAGPFFLRFELMLLHGKVNFRALCTPSSRNATSLGNPGEIKKEHTHLVIDSSSPEDREQPHLHAWLGWGWRQGLCGWFWYAVEEPTWSHGTWLVALLDTLDNLLKQRNKAMIRWEDFPVKNYDCKNNPEHIALFEQGQAR